MKRQDLIDLDDRSLARAYLLHRDEASFRALYQRHTSVLFAVALRLLQGSQEDTEEVIQETWTCAAEKLGAFRWESALQTWLVSIAVNCARNRIRQRVARSTIELGEVAELPATKPIKRDIDPIDMERAIDALPDGYRQVLVLHDVHGHTHDEVANMLGISQGTSKSQLARARRSLRRCLNRSGDDNDERRLQ